MLSKFDSRLLSMSKTPIILLSLFLTGTTISDLDLESQAMCPGN